VGVTVTLVYAPPPAGIKGAADGQDETRTTYISGGVVDCV
jgi:hypothetical protein